jgi:hypothetical protein
MSIQAEDIEVKQVIGPKRRRRFAKRAAVSEPKTFPSDESEFPDEPEVVDNPTAAIITKEAALTAPRYAHSLTVTNQTSLDTANSFLKDLKAVGAKIAETFDRLISQAHEHHKSLLAEKKKFMDPLAQAEVIVKRTIAGFLAEEDRKRHEAESERAGVEAEARRQAEAMLKAAEEAEAKGDIVKADALINKAEAELDKTLAAAPVVPEAPNASGLTLREDWKFQVIDKSLLPREYLIPDEVKIGRVVRALKSEAKIPGVRVWSEKSVSSRI